MITPPFTRPTHHLSVEKDITQSDVTWDNINGAPVNMHFNLTFPEEEIEPLFSGGCWAGTVIWEAARLLCDYLIDHQQDLAVKDAVVLELGSGVGVPGLTASLLGGNVVLTEQSPLGDLLAINVNNNRETLPGNVQCETLDWYNAEKGIEVLFEDVDTSQWDPSRLRVVLISDCIYEQLYGKSWEALAKVLKCVCNKDTVVLNSCERRNMDGIDKFNDLAKELGFDVEVVYENKGPNGEDLVLFAMKLRT